MILLFNQRIRTLFTNSKTPYHISKGFVIETLSTPYVRIFKITEAGLE